MKARDYSSDGYPSAEGRPPSCSLWPPPCIPDLYHQRDLTGEAAILLVLPGPKRPEQMLLPLITSFLLPKPYQEQFSCKHVFDSVMGIWH